MISPGFTIRNDSASPLKVGARRFRGSPILDVGAPVQIEPGQSVHFFANAGVCHNITRGSSETIAPPPMTIDELREKAAFAYADPVYGQKWQDRLIAIGKINPRTLRRWLDGSTPIPGPLSAMVRAHYMLRKYGEEIPE